MITSLNVNYTVFNMDGTPDPGQGRHHPRGRLVAQGRARTRPPMRTTCAASTSSSRARRSQSVAQAELGNPGYWRAIAEVNGIDDPLRVRPGQALLIPSVADAARQS